jgi:integrase
VRLAVFKPAKAALPADKQHLRFHDLRHTCASLLIANGASIMLVSKRLGHASTRMTLDRYSWMYPSEEAAMAVALDAVWEAAPATPAPADLDARRTRRAN